MSRSPERNEGEAIPRSEDASPGEIASSAEYSHDPQELYAWRNQVADLIDRSRGADANPWGTHFNVRGFPVP